MEVRPDDPQGQLGHTVPLRDLFQVPLGNSSGAVQLRPWLGGWPTPTMVSAGAGASLC